MADIQELFREAWSQALVGLNAVEVEVERVLARLIDAAVLSREDAWRQVRELGERLSAQRREIERAVDEAVSRAASRFKLPTKEDVEALKRRLDQISKRIETLISERKS